jgi:hypothetical protein
MRIRAMIVSLIGGIALVFSAGVAAAQPEVPKGEPFTFAKAKAGELCPFPVLIEAKASQFVRTTLPNGVLVITGPGTATVTNTKTGESATFNISGPGQFDPATNRLTLFGQSLILEFAKVDGTPFVITTSGQVGFIIDQPIDQPLRGHISHDICAELA